MSTPGQMVRALADLFDMSESSVDVLDRGLAAAGLRAKSPRGRAATQVTPRDVAHDVIALCMDASIRDTPAFVECFSKLELKGGKSWTYQGVPDDPDIRNLQEHPPLTPKGILEGGLLQEYPREDLPMAATFGGSLASLLEHLPDLTDMRRVEVRMLKELPGARISFRLGEQRVVVDFGKGGERGADLGLCTIKSLNMQFLLSIAAILRNKKRPRPKIPQA